jgi:alpha-galactosidase
MRNKETGADTMRKRIVLIGAGSAMFGLGALGDIFKCGALEGSAVVLHDINESALKRVESVVRGYIDQAGLPFEVLVTTSRPDALKEADFCIISIEAGNRYELWEQDWRLPLQLGIPQVYGENGGPGGLFHSLRIIPPILDICEDITHICPQALIINLSNPMTTIMQAILKKFPELQVVGLCHEISSLIEHLPKILGVRFSDLSIKAGGLNHFSVLAEATYKATGTDAYPNIREKAMQYYEALPERGLFREFVRIYGCLPNTTDSHFGEYIQWAHEVADHQGILDFYNKYVHECTKPVNEYRRLKVGTLASEYWRVVPVIEGVVTNSGHEELAVNIRNDGLISCLPADVVVEVPAIVDESGIHGIPVSMPKGFAALLRNRVGVLELTADAAIEGSKELALQALLAEPVVNSLKNAEKLLDMMMKYQEDFLGYLK